MSSANGNPPLSAVALVCSLKRSPAPSSSALMAEHVSEQLRNAGVKTESLRCVDYAILPGVQADMDGAHKVVADCFQALNDIGYTIPAQGCTYWNGRRCSPRITTTSTKCLTRWRRAPRPPPAMRRFLAGALRSEQYPPYQ
jgi:hypothetical protein